IFVTAWKLPMPFPSTLDNRVERLELRLPAKFLFDSLRGSDEPWRVAWSAWFFDRLQFSSSDFGAGFDHFSNARTTTSAEVVTAAGGFAESQNMRVGEIEDVNVIANTGSIWRVVVGSVNFDVRSFSESHLQHSWNEMRLRSMVFAKSLGCAGGIEVAQTNKFHPMNLVVPTKNFFESEFGFAGGTDGTRLRGFVDWQAIRRTKKGACRRKDDPPHTSRDHGIEQIQSIADRKRHPLKPSP